MKMIIGGKFVDKEKKINVLNPEDESVIDTVPSADNNDVETAFNIAKEGAVEMEKLSAYDRYSILLKAAEIINSRLEEFAKTIAMEGIKTIKEARLEVKRAINTVTYAAEEAKRIYGEVIPMDGDFRSLNRFGYWVREPVGVVLAITPYNDPLNMVAHKSSPAIAAGNALVLKPTYLTPLSAIKMGEVFLEAGLPEKAISIITGKSSEIGDSLVSNPIPRVVAFTGGVEAGETITKNAGLKKIFMELGSSSAVIVLDDADLERAIPSIVSGSFWAAGQNCIGVQRVYIHKDVYDKFVDGFVEMTKNYNVGKKLNESTDMGPMITKEEANRVESWVKEAVDMGAKVLCGAKREGNFYWPTALENPPREAKVVSKEVFGPVVSFFRIDTLDEGINGANDSEYGLHAAIFTQDVDRALEAAKRLKFGGVLINDSTDFRVDYMPFGGYKHSGIGREGLRFAIEEMSEVKMVIFTKK